MKNAILVARRELRLQLRSKGFLLSIAATVVVVAAIVVVPQLLDRDAPVRVGLVGEESQALAEPLVELARQAQSDVEVSRPAGEQQAGDDLREGRLDAVVVDGRVLLTDGVPDQQVAALVQGANATVGVTAGLTSLGVAESDLLEALQVAPLEERSVSGREEGDDTRQGVALVVLLTLLYLFMTTTVGVGAGVVEEKASRIVEVLLVAVRPWQLLTGRLVAFGLLGLGQLVAVAAAGVGSALAIGIGDDLPPGMPGIVALCAVAYVLGFLFFGAMAAALGSLVSRQEETNGALAPLTAALVLSYVGAYAAVARPELAVSQVLTVLPPVSSVALPVQIAAGNATGTDVVIGVGLLIAAIVGVVLLASRIYENSVLRVGTRVGIRDAFRGRL